VTAPETPRPPSGPAAVGRALLGFLLILGCLAVGDGVTLALRIPVPGSVIGMLLLLVVLSTARSERLNELVRPSATLLVAVIPLLLVPVAVGLVDHLAELGQDIVPILVAIAGGWLVTVVVTALLAALGFPSSDRRRRKVRR